ncbi:hypothetical protein [Winogradskya consettensis]|uniref:hypothetical protein n=1 Tax=Winogradskya consettensis TaxID=113560 RepID=UPI001BB2F04D|nr:hypothetical protein [Actinoplanes consettensis]
MSATVLTAAAVIVIGYRVSRTHAGATRRSVHAKHKIYLGHVRPMLLGGLFFLAIFVVAALDAAS